MFLLAGCKPEIGPPLPYTPESEGSIIIGDSLCSDFTVDFQDLSWVISQIRGDCVPGRQLIDLSELPNDKAVVFLSLGINDARLGVDSEVYGAHLTELLSTTDATVYCVLPRLGEAFEAYSVDLHRAEMLNRCTHTIDPLDYDVINRYEDNIHWNEIDNYNFSVAINERKI